MSALLILLFDSLVRRRLARTQSWSRTAQIAAIVAAVALFGSLFHMSGEKAFKIAFGMPSPAGVQNLSVDCNFRLVDTTQLLHFTADRATVDQIMAHRGFRRIRETTEDYPQERDWDAVWRRVFGSFPDQGGSAWRNVAPMKIPTHFRWENEGTQEQVDLLWDTQTGRAYVRYVTL